MANKEKLQEYNTRLVGNNDKLTSILSQIQQLPDAKKTQTKEIEITENGETIVEPDEGFDALDSVKITTNVEGSGGLDYEFLGCESSEEANYLEQIMPEIINMKFKGEILWD